MPDLKVSSETHAEQLYVTAVPGALFRLSRGVSKLRATVCGNCGYTEFHAVEYPKMWDEWREENT